ncbi:MAG: hypothetical protein ABEH80_07340 [Halobaculum sp.]
MASDGHDHTDGTESAVSGSTTGRGGSDEGGWASITPRTGVAVIGVLAVGLLVPRWLFVGRESETDLDDRWFDDD